MISRLNEKFFYKPETAQDRINRIKIQSWRKISIDYFEESWDKRIWRYAKELRKHNIPIPARVRYSELRVDSGLE
jgi:hypothetical protein